MKQDHLPIKNNSLSKKQKFRQFLSLLSGSFFLVIAIMPLTGILLGVGSIIAAQENFPQAAKTIGQLLATIGNSFFTNLGFFFCIAVVIGFTKNWLATMSAVWGYFVFISVQGGLLPNIDLSGTSFDFWFYKNVPTPIAANNLGIISMNTSVLGGISTAVIIIWCFKSFKNINLPSFLQFFSGARFVPFAVTLFVIPLSLFYLLVWPALGMLLIQLGQGLGHLPIGLNSFLMFGIWRLLTPIGIHHAFYSIFWFTPVGGQLNGDWWMKNPNNGLPIKLDDWCQQHGGVVSNWPSGDIYIWQFFIKYNIPFTTHFYTNPNLSHAVSGVHPGQYLGGNYPICIGGAIGGVLAMITMAPKENKKTIASIMMGGMITSVAIGVTEPIFWSYLVVAPLLFFGFDVLMNALGAMLLFILNSHVGATFSNGVLDWFFYGVLPFHLGTNPQWAILISVLYIPIYYFVYVYYMKITKKTFPIIDSKIPLNEKSKIRKQFDKDAVAKAIIIGLGGKNNIISIFNCATRVRVDVKDVQKINEQIILKSGAYKMIFNGNNIQIIYGTNAQAIATLANEQLKGN